MFLANLEVYGSLNEGDKFITDYMTQCRFLTIEQFEMVITKLERLPKSSNPLIQKLVAGDIPILVEILKKA